MLQKGALLAQNPHDFQHLDCLTDEDKEHITHEGTHK